MSTAILQTTRNVVWEVTTAADWLVRAKVMGLLAGYDARWATITALFGLQKIETEYTAPLKNIDTGRDSRTWTLAGKLDKLGTQDGVVLIDHKTTSMDISDPAATYWRQLAIDGQATHSELLLLANDIKIDRITWDVVRKPGISPKKLAKAMRASVLSDRMYCGRIMSNGTLEYLQTEERENGELYEARLALECTENPDKYFARRSVPRTRYELAEYLKELWQIGNEIRLARNNKTHYRNAGACMMYGSPCQFLGICSGYDTSDSDRWQLKESVHTELSGDYGDGRHLLTNSRIRCFQTCRRKHYYQYELGIERVDEEEKEALFFGSTWHVAMDAWWQAITSIGDKNGNCNTDAAGSELVNVNGTQT